MLLKSYTDINQSKQLSGILPVETADMCYRDNIAVLCPYILASYKASPCWSLNALLEQIPNYEIHKTDKVGIICCQYGLSEMNYDHLIDACVSLIIKINSYRKMRRYIDEYFELPERQTLVHNFNNIKETVVNLYSNGMSIENIVKELQEWLYLFTDEKETNRVTEIINNMINEKPVKNRFTGVVFK